MHGVSELWDWDLSPDSAVVVQIYESDPGIGREYDTFIRSLDRRDDHSRIDTTYFIPRIEFRTATLPEAIAEAR